MMAWDEVVWSREPSLIVELGSWRVIDANAHALTLLGHSRDALGGHDVSALAAPEDAQSLRAALGAPDSAWKSIGLWRLRCGDGQWRIFELSARLCSARGGGGLMVRLRDAARLWALQQERDELFRRCEQSNEVLARMQGLLNVGIWRLDSASKRFVWSDNIYAILGVPASFSADLKTYAGLVHPDDRDAMIKGFESFLASGERVFEYHHRIIRSDGAVVHLTGVAEWEGKLGQGWIRGLVQDVSVSTKDKAALSNALAMLSIAGKSARLGGRRVELDPLTLSWTPETVAIHEESDDVILTPERGLSYYAPEYRPIIEKAFTDCIENGRAFDELLQIITAKGKRIWVRSIGEAVLDKQGKVRAVQGAFQDVSELVAARDRSEDMSRRLVETLEHISDAFFTLDHEWRFTFLNSKAEALLRRPRADLLGKGVWDEFAASAQTIFEREYQRAMNEKQTVRFREYYPPLEAWFDVIAYPTPEGLAVHFRDVTTLRAQDEQLRLLETAVARQNDIVIITEAEPIDAPGGPKIVYVNDAFVRKTGYKREEVLGKTPRILQGPNTQRAELERIRTALTQWRPVRSELINYTKSGEEIWLEVDITPISDAAGWHTHWVAIERDVTARKRGEQAIALSEERFRLVAQATNDVIWDWDLTTGSVWWNENLKSLFGHDPALVERGPESWTSRIHPEDKDRVLEGVHAVIDGAETHWVDEYRFTHADGRAVTVIDRGFVIRNNRGEAVRMLGSMLDVTEYRQLESRLRQSQKLEAVGQLTGGVAHDFNNLLTVILGNSEALQIALREREDLSRLAAMTVLAAERGAELTARLLSFSRQQPLEPRGISVNDLLIGMEGMLRRTLAETIDIKLALSPGLWIAEIDPGQLETALLNLAINARDAMKDGGRLTIETANAEIDAAYAATEQGLDPGQYVRIVVSDTGCGMSPDMLARAFEPFFTTKEVGKGSGLGLSMVYGFVKQSGGHIRIYSEQHEGTSVKLYFKRSSMDAGQQQAPHAEPASVIGGDEAILVVEDDVLVRGHLTAQLKGLGYRVIAAEAGREALDILDQTQDLDLLLTDVVLPGGINGRELAQLALAANPKLKVLFTSGYSENAIMHHGRLDVGVELLSKPYRREMLAEKVRKVLDS